MRSNTFTEETARLLRSAGCHSIGMSVEAGDEHVRNIILKRGLSDTVVKNSFVYAKKYGIKTYGNTILAIPGTNYNDDFNSFLFTKKIGMTVPTFSIFNPYPKTALTEYAKKIGVLDPSHGLNHQVGFLSPLNCYTDKEKKRQLGLAYLGPLFCSLPDMFIPALKLLLHINALKFYKYLGTAYMVLKTGLFIFPGIYPLNPLRLFKLFIQSVQFFIPGKTFSMVKGYSKNNYFKHKGDFPSEKVT